MVGTANLIGLALTNRLKRIDNVSTIAVAFRAGLPPVSEDDDMRAAIPAKLITNDYANGYVTSKWAGEVLLRQAHDHVALLINVFRPTMIMPHSRYAGQINMPDVFARLLFSIVSTGLAPASFYAPPAHPADRPHYDGLPVDFIANAMIAIQSASGDAGFATYNVSNPHDDGISLDQFVEGIEIAGYPVTRIPDYFDWLNRFEIALHGLS